MWKHFKLQLHPAAIAEGVTAEEPAGAEEMVKATVVEPEGGALAISHQLEELQGKLKDRIPHHKNDNRTGYEILPCVFCNNQQHTARSCMQNMKPDTVHAKALAAYLCLNCLRKGHFASSCPHPGCEMDGCQAKHHKKMHGHTDNSSRRQ